MRGLCLVALFIGLGTSFSGGQQNSTSTPPPAADTQPAKVMIYTEGPGVTAPELFSSYLQPIPDEKCKKKVNAAVMLSSYIDAAGVPNNITLLQSSDSELDELALKTIAADRFKPGTYNGAPVAVAESIEVNLRACLEQETDTSGKKTAHLRLLLQPEQKFAPLDMPPMEAVLTPGAISPLKIVKGVTPPVPLNNIEAEFSDEARRAGFQGVVVVSIIVDAQGMPHNPRVMRSVGMGLDEKAIEAVKKYRFKPAMKDGMPVPVMINVEINFRLYNRHIF
jgi:TonB family protein